MKLETILNAMVIAIQDYYKVKYDIPYLEKRLRQARTFRDRIIRMDAEKGDIIGRMEEHVSFQDDVIDDQKQRIAELEAVMPELCVDCYQIYYDMIEAEELSNG